VSDASDCVVFDAQRVSDGPIATIRLPEKICSGTHSYWSNHAP
jgi:carotenoid cleavage dioxygenase-like enzyme